MENKPEILTKGIALEDWNYDISCKECWTSSRVNHAHIWTKTGYSHYASCPSCDSEVHIDGNRIPISIRRIANDNWKIKTAIESKIFWSKFRHHAAVLAIAFSCLAAFCGCISFAYYHGVKPDFAKVGNK